ncbi:coproporphyrinogen III oxidase [Brevibacillus sp. FIR094]|uniref:coproporphyrinogen III oxidase n=1 Tax=Brevibacillus sp. FIR094 TaxID=3134809 RepID=UPI003D22868B
MGLTHEFFLLRSESDDEPVEQVVLSDNLVLYIWDSFRWIPAFNPSTKENHVGLNYHGITLIRHEGANLLKDICLSWSSLFSLAPSTLQLTGDFVMDENGNGRYEKLNFTRDDLTKPLTTLAAIADRAFLENYIIVHHGI